MQNNSENKNRQNGQNRNEQNSQNRNEQNSQNRKSGTENKKQSNKIVKRSAKIIKKLKLKPILSANEEDSMVDIYCVGEGDVANDLIITVKKGDKGGVVVISGELSLETTGDIIEKMQ